MRRRISSKRSEGLSRVFVQDIAGRFGRSFHTRSGDFTLTHPSTTVRTQPPQEAGPGMSGGQLVEGEPYVAEARQRPRLHLSRAEHVVLASPSVADIGQGRGQDVAPLTAVGSSHAPTLAPARMADEEVQWQEARRHQAGLLESPRSLPSPALNSLGWPPATRRSGEGMMVDESRYTLPCHAPQQGYSFRISQDGTAEVLLHAAAISQLSHRFLGRVSKVRRRRR